MAEQKTGRNSPTLRLRRRRKESTRGSPELSPPVKESGAKI